MKFPRSTTRAAIGLGVLALVATACRGGETSDGISDDPCPGEWGVNEDNGCIYLGAISDLTSGPFAPLANPITNAQKAFWMEVNNDGGVGGYDIALRDSDIFDSKYNVSQHVEGYQGMRTDVAALAQTLGSSQTVAILEDMKSDDIVGAPASWNSAWDFETQIINTGASYCFEAMNGVDWILDERDVDADTVMAVGFDNDYGEDAGVGVEIAAEERGLDFTGITTPAGSNNQDGTVARITDEEPDILVITTGPSEMAAIVGRLGADWEGEILGSGPTWNPAVMDSAAAEAVAEKFTHIGPWKSFGADTPGHERMREAIGDREDLNEGYTAGWAWSYGLLAVFEAAAELDGGITRENLVEASQSIEEVDYEGFLPPEAGNVNEPFRGTIVGQVDEEAVSGLSEITEDFYVGPTAEGYEYDGPCAVLTE